METNKLCHARVISDELIVRSGFITINLLLYLLPVFCTVCRGTLCGSYAILLLYTRAYTFIYIYIKYVYLYVCVCVCVLVYI